MTSEAKGLVGIAIVACVILFGGVFLFSKQPSLNSEPVALDPSLLVREDSNKTSQEDSSKLLLVEFGDYQCPSCASAHPYVANILEDFGDKVTFVFRNFPLSQHKNAVSAAKSAEAAGEQGKYWEMYDMLFIKQEDWAESSDPVGKFVEFAKEIGLDEERFKASIASDAFSGKIFKDQRDGELLGVNATPTFFINQKKFTGNFTSLYSSVEQELKSKE